MHYLSSVAIYRNPSSIPKHPRPKDWSHALPGVSGLFFPIPDPLWRGSHVIRSTPDLLTGFSGLLL